ncbi:DUF2079 domain-containing protein [Actinomyces succiniciruminis]|uniref:Membrane protein, PF09852 n=1 Tax=Actinomyces succiniciruminis TaxID=1522002 RepID=A0A1L7RCG2_9ACTO|nr:DUF2079 domain-containing protein [Actinomyces succiniciruminis]CED91625.1 Membrane protein, PF09852 [Actinomyces succiniciruminis]
MTSVDTRPDHTLAHRSPRSSRWLFDRLPAALAVIVGAVTMIVYSVGQWRSMQVPSWDLAIFSELAKAYSRLQAPIVTIKGEGYNLLGDHFHPLLVLLGPVWRLFPTPLALLVMQDLLLAVSAWPLTRLATRLLNRPVAALLGLFYVLSWGLQGAVAAQFHEIAFAVPLLAWASVAFVERRWRSCAWWLAPLVLVKEDLGLTVFMAGLAIALRGLQGEPQQPTSRGPNWWRRLGTTRLGFAVALFGLLAFLLTVLVFLPLLSPSGAWEYGLSDDGASAGLLSRLFSPEVKLATLGMLIYTAGGIGLASPWMTLVLPTLAWRFLSGNEFYWGWQNWHYNAILMPIALGALLDVVARLKARRTEANPATASRAPASGWLTAPVWARLTVALGVVVPLAAGVGTARDLPLWSLTQPGFGAASWRAQAAAEVSDVIPDGASVETDLGLLAYLVPDHTVYWVGTSTVDTDYVVVDSSSSAWGGNPPADAAAWASERSATGATYELVLDTGGYQVARRVN